MKPLLQTILTEIDKNYDIVAGTMEKATTKEVFMDGVLTALILVNGLDLLRKEE